MNRSDVTFAATALHQARLNGQLLDDLGAGAPHTLDEGYEIQDALAEAAAESVAGWKVGCTGSAAQEMLGIPHPFAGRVLAPYLTSTPARFASSAFQAPSVEGEIAFEMAAELAPRSEPYSVADVEATVGGVRATIEVVDTRFANLRTAGGPNLIADVGANGGLVVGELITDWTNLDLAALAVSMQVNGEIVGQGTGADVLGHPLESLAWLANHLSSRGQALAAGALVSTGTCTGVASLPAGAMAVTDHGPLGSVQLTWAR
ncbi:MAG: hydratase [Actinomycetia bacterium]|nr:hydratase [Actinomycetes bacterium]